MRGVSVQANGNGSFKLRWRERRVVDGVAVQKARAETVWGEDTADKLKVEIAESLKLRGYWDRPARPETRITSMEKACAAWIASQRARGLSVGTIRKYGSAMSRWFSTVRAVRSLPSDKPVMADIMSRQLFSDVVLAWRERNLSESTIYSTALTVYSAWRWVGDDPEEYPGVPPAPRDPTTVLPLAPIYVAPIPPTLAEADAVLRRLGPHATVARVTGIVMRYTGLRASQVLALRRGDLDAEAAVLTVRHGKTRRERAEVRTIPVSRHLVNELACVIANQKPDDSLVPRRRDLRAPVNRNHLPSATLSGAWEAATLAGEVRREVWSPPSRKLDRPEHAFRAAFQAFLEQAGVRESVIDRLVGHAPRNTRGRHYAPPDPAALRAAADALPAIDWNVPAENIVRIRDRF